MSKFKPLTFYKTKKTYKLLPFKFDRFNDHQYIVTNMVGQYHLINNKNFVSFAEGDLEDKNLLADLRSKQFCYFEGEKSPHELLGLKVRTQYANLANFTSLHMFVVTLRCDHSCPYCQVSRQTEDKGKFDMTHEMADKAITMVFKSPSRNIKIEFQGGEPLLNFELVKYIVQQSSEINKNEHRNLQFVIATTLSLINDEILDFCCEYDIHLSSSLDGPRELHNLNRPRPKKNSYEKFIDGLNRSREKLGFDKVSALMTTTENSLDYVEEIIDEYIKNGFDGIFLRALSPYGFAIKTKQYLRYHTERWVEFYKKGLDYIISLNKQGIQFTEFFTKIIVTKMLTAHDTGYVDMMNPSGIGIAAIVYNYDGDVYASDESRMLAEMNDKSFKLGNVLKHTYEEVIMSENLLKPLEESMTTSSPMCSDCSYERFCGSDPVYHHATQKDFTGRKYESGFCQKNMTVFKYLIELMEQDTYVKNLFNRWANE